MNIAGIAPNVWFPVVTLVVGAALNALFDALADRRTSAREREARHEQRLDTVRLRRVEFQRATLLELQEVTAQYVRFHGRANHEDEMAFRISGVWGRQQLTTEVDDGLHKTQVRLTILKERVRDARIRQHSKALLDASVAVTLSKSQSQAAAGVLELIERQTELQEQVGTVLRSLDDDEDRLLDQSQLATLRNRCSSLTLAQGCAA